MTRRIRSIVLNVLLSGWVRRGRRAFAEFRRRILRRPHVVSVFLQLDDPYSYLLAHYLPDLERCYNIKLRVYLSEARGGGYKPEPEMLAEYAVVDCRRLAGELGVPFLDKGQSPPVEHRRPMLDAIANLEGDQDFAAELLQSLAVYWRGDAEAAARRDGAGSERSLEVIARSQRLQDGLGHYNSATLHYAGEWFWGVDRLHYLLERLDALGAARIATPLLASLRQATQVTLPVAPPGAARNLPPLELFHSFRSPYSYLALRRSSTIADAFGLRLVVRPVLPMVMRGMQVPRHKLLYVAKDAAREAERNDVAFGNIADPVGAGVERCLAVFYLAESQNREREFLLDAGAAIWSQAVDVASDAGLRKVTDRTGLSWPEVVAAIESDNWRKQVEHNRESMIAAGCWGVPTLRIGGFVAWGQDRDWLLVRYLEELCDTGDGILV